MWKIEFRRNHEGSRMLRQSAICFFFFFLRCSSTQEFYFRRRQTEIVNEKILKSLFGNENLRGIRILIRIFNIRSEYAIRFVLSSSLKLKSFLI